jgi:DNA-binding NtrC family response regulator
MKVRYIETSPVKQTLEFESREKFNEFYANRINEIMNYTYPNNINFYEYFKREIVHLNKDGTPRKEHYPKQLMTKKAQKKQREKFAEYCERRKKQTIERGYRRKKAEIEAKIDYWKSELKRFEEGHQLGEI